MKDPNVEFAGYTVPSSNVQGFRCPVKLSKLSPLTRIHFDGNQVPHPSEPKMNVRVQTHGTLADVPWHQAWLQDNKGGMLKCLRGRS